MTHKENQTFQKLKNPISFRLQVKCRKRKPSSEEDNKQVDRYNEKFIKTTPKEGRVQKKRRRKEGENSSTAVDNYDMAAGEKLCKKSELQKNKKQQKRKLWQDADNQRAKKQKIHVLMPESKS